MACSHQTGQGCLVHSHSSTQQEATCTSRKQHVSILQEPTSDHKDRSSRTATAPQVYPKEKAQQVAEPSWDEQGFSKGAVMELADGASRGLWEEPSNAGLDFPNLHGLHPPLSHIKDDWVLDVSWMLMKT